jgi:hypothetical protein
MITHISGFELSRSTILSMMRAEREELAEQRARDQAAEERREQAVARAQAYYHEHGEWEWETRARERELAARREQAELSRAQQEREQLRQTRYAELIASGQQPRTVAEILAAAALYP